MSGRTIIPFRAVYLADAIKSYDGLMNEPRRKRTGYRPLKTENTFNLLLTPQSGGVLDP